MDSTGVLFLVRWPNYEHILFREQVWFIVCTTVLGLYVQQEAT